MTNVRSQPLHQPQALKAAVASYHSGGVPSVASKEALEDGGERHTTSPPPRPISTTVIKLNNFAQWSSSGCVLPYLSVYFLHYTQATASDVGAFMLLSAMLGIIVSFLFSSLGDRYRAHRRVYLSSLTISYVSYLILFIPIILTGTGDGEASSALLEPLMSSLNDTTTTTTTAVAQQDREQPIEVIRTTLDQTNPIWFYVIGVCVAVGGMSSSVNMNFSDSFSANAAKSNDQALKCDAKISGGGQLDKPKGSSSTSFGQLRFFGSIGWCLSSLSLSIVNELNRELPYLLPSWLIFVLAATLNILLVACWPDRRPFDLAETSTSSTMISGHDNGHDNDEKFRRDGDHEKSTSFDLDNNNNNDTLGQVCVQQPHLLTARRSGWLAAIMGGKTRLELLSSTLAQDVGQVGARDGVALISGRSFHFDPELNEHEEPLDPLTAGWARRRGSSANVRRCSIAPLGQSYICEQFVIGGRVNDNKNHADTKHETRDGRWQHFKHIARIEPMSVAKLEELVECEQQVCSEIAPPNVRHHRRSPEDQEASEANNRLSFKLYLKIIELIARRNQNMLRFMLLYMTIGFIISMNWVYLFPYLEHLDEVKFKSLAAYVMISGYLSETAFYYVSSWFTKRVSASNGLSLVLLMFASRYAMYLTFAYLPNEWWPLELVVLIELSQSVTQGWFECIFNESALEFALEAERCVPKLIELKLMPNTPDSIEQVRNSVKLTLFSVSSCCFDGFGVGFGSLLGGWIVHKHGYCALWTSCACFALAVCLLNLLFEFLLAASKRRRRCRQQRQRQQGSDPSKACKDNDIGASNA